MVFNALNNISNLVEPVNSMNNSPTVNGQVLSFFYSHFDHDPYPIIISTGPMTYGRIGGLNLHYLTFPIFRALLNNWAGNPAFNYFIIKNQLIIKNAFRSYKITGIKNVKKIHYKAILEAMSIQRNFSPQEMLAIQQAVDQYVLSRQPEILNELFGNMMAEPVQPTQSIQSTQPIQPIQAIPTVGTEV